MGDVAGFFLRIMMIVVHCAHSLGFTNRLSISGAAFDRLQLFEHAARDHGVH